MALLEMKKIRIIVHQDDTSNLLGLLQKLGVVEFTDASLSYEDHNLNKKEKTAFEFNYVSSRLDFAVNFLSKFQKKNPIKKVLEDQREFVTEEKIEKTANTFYYNDLIEKVADLETQISEAGQKIQKLDEEKKILSEWTKLDLPLGLSLTTQNTESLFIKIKENEEDLESVLKEKGFTSSVLPVNDNNFVLTFLKQDKESIIKVLNEFGSEVIDLPKRRGTPEEEIERIDRAKIKALKAIESAEVEAKKIADESLSELKILSDHFHWKRQKDDVLVSAVGTSNISVFEAWCPISKFEKLNKTLEEKIKAFTIEDIEPKEGEVPPVEIENKGIFKSFETITRLYGLPQQGNLDPTMFLAAFFFIFFGLCLTDVGYGLFVLAIISAIFFFFKVPKEIKPLFKLIMLGGLASVVVGFFFGGYLGINAEYLPSWLKKAQLFDPVASPLPVFYLSLALGVLQVIVGMILNIITEIKNKNALDGVLGQGSWLFMFSALTLFILGKMEVIPGGEIYPWLLVASLLAIVVIQGRKEKGVVKKVFKGTLSLYGFVGYFSDVLSYSRLLALGLATSALAFAVNLIAVLARDMIPYVGLILMVIILIIGHLFNMVVNILGAFIHSARLQFVEFFGKFLTGTGRNFRPFKQEERNVVLVESLK